MAPPRNPETSILFCVLRARILELINLGSAPRVSYSGSLGYCVKICISKKFLGRPHFVHHCLRAQSMLADPNFSGNLAQKKKALCRTT
jgi:hypothetical protein